MKSLVQIIFFILICSMQAQARSILLGHNLGTTTETPPAKTLTLGSYLAAYSPTDELLIGTSTWMMWGYNSYNLVARYGWIREDKTFDALSVQAAYLKSGHFGPDFYRQEVAMLWLTGKIEVNPFYDLYITGNYMYFFDETIAFSLRREPFNDEKYQLTLTTLHTLKYNDNWMANLEFGILGLRAKYPQVHSGFSVAYKQPSYLVQLGFTVTSTPYNLERLFSTSTNSRPTEDYYDASVHPEVQLQWFF